LTPNSGLQEMKRSFAGLYIRSAIA